MTMRGTTMMIMTMLVTKTMIMTIVATTTMTKISKKVQEDNLLLVQNDKKGCENSICTSSLKKIFFPLISLLDLSVEPALPHKNL